MALTLLEHPGHMVPQPLPRLLVHNPPPVLLVLARVLQEVMALAALDLRVLVALPQLVLIKEPLERLVHPAHLQAVMLLDLLAQLLAHLLAVVVQEVMALAAPDLRVLVAPLPVLTKDLLELLVHPGHLQAVILLDLPVQLLAHLLAVVVQEVMALAALDLRVLVAPLRDLKALPELLVLLAQLPVLLAQLPAHLLERTPQLEDPRSIKLYFIY